MVPLLSKVGLPIVLAFLAVELTYSWWQNDGKYDRKDTLSNLGGAVINNVLSRFVWAALAYAAYFWVYSFAPIKLATTGWLPWAGALLLADFIWYWEHRFGHIVRILWAIHSVHHSSEKFNYSVALRLPWLGGLSRIPFLMPMALLGFSPDVILLSFSLVLLYQIWVHTEYVGKIGVLEEILMTPSHHRVHHAVNPQYLDKNYGGILILWDKLFGTFVREQERPIYGLTTPIETHNVVQLTSSPP